MFEDYWTWRGPQWMARLQVTLDDVATPIERTIEVDATLSAFDLHSVLQVAFGWNDSHLHEFNPGSTSSPLLWQGPSRSVDLVIVDTEDPERDLPWWVEALDEFEITVGQLLAMGRSSAEYVYDYGENWCHSLQLTEAFEPSRDLPRARIIDAAGPSPLDDVGGYPGLDRLWAVLSQPDHPHYGFVWEEVQSRVTDHTLGYDLAAKKLLTGSLDTDRLNETLLRQFGLMVPELGD